MKYNEKLHNDDHTSVLLWVQKMREEENCPVLFFKHQGHLDDNSIFGRSEADLLKGEDFLLVIMTAAQEELLKSL